MKRKIDSRANDVMTLATFGEHTMKRKIDSRATDAILFAEPAAKSAVQRVEKTL